jgi:ATP-binding cassette subfamily B protein
VRAQRGCSPRGCWRWRCSSAATLSLPVAFRRMIDQGFSSASNIDRAFVLLFVRDALALALATAARFYFVSLLGERVVADCASSCTAHLLGLDPGFFDRTRSGELVSRLSADTELLRSVVGSSMSVALRSLIMVLGSIAMMFVTSPHLASVHDGRHPAVRAADRDRQPAPAEDVAQSQDRVADANALASEVLGAVRTVQAHAREPYERGRFGRAVARAVATARAHPLQAIVTAVAIRFFGAIIAGAVVGAHDVVAGA